MNRGDRAIRIVTAATVVLVGAIAAVISYRHALAVIRDHGETGVTALLVPVSVDGLLLVAALVMLDAARHGQRAPWLAKLALACGIGATITLNAMHGAVRGPVSASLAALPAITLVISVELLMGLIRSGRETADPAPVPDLETDPVPDPETVPGGWAMWDHIPTDPAPAAPSVALTATVETGGPELAGLVGTARDRFAEDLAAGDLPSLRRIRSTLHVGHEKASAVRAALEAAPALSGSQPR